MSLTFTALAVTVVLSACGSEGSVVYVDDVVTPTTAPPLVVPATTISATPLTAPES